MGGAANGFLGIKVQTNNENKARKKTNLPLLPLIPSYSMIFCRSLTICITLTPGFQQVADFLEGGTQDLNVELVGYRALMYNAVHA